jgi:Recombination endonuclease VII
LDFDKFAEDIGGNRPSPKHQLRRVDENYPYSADNYRWVDPVLMEDGNKFEDRDSYVREWTVRKYGLGEGKYAEMLKKQNGVCAICEKEETSPHQNGKVRVLAIDHCHNKLHVRGLLCSRCNLMLGYSRDNPTTLRKAADYLEHHDSQVGRDSPPE